MHLITPWSALAAAAVAIPLLILLYFLKLRRRPLRVSSTLLWEKTFLDLQVNAPFQRLRWSILLLLQLLLLLALLAALAEPVLTSGGGHGSSRIVLLIDRSASMNARTADQPQAPTRLELAKQSARDLVENQSRSSRAAAVMIVSFAGRAQVVHGFESNRRTLLEAIDSIQPTDEEANLESALQLAGAFTSQRDEHDRQDAPLPEVVVISDGGVAAPRELSTFQLRSGTFRFVPIGMPAGPEWATSQVSAVDNLGIVAFSARRDFDDPARLRVFARLINAGPQAIDAVLTLWVDDQPSVIVRRSISAASEINPGEDTVQADVELSAGAVLSLRHNHADALPADDTAWLVVPPPTKPRIVIVHPDDSPVDPNLMNIVDQLETPKMEVISHTSYAARDAQQVDSGGLWDLIIFDRVAAQRWPGVPTLTIGAVPNGIKTIALPESAAGGGRHILSWDRQHPLMRHVALDTIVYTGFGGFEFSNQINATPLVFGPDGPVIALITTRQARHVMVGFELARSNWPLHVSVAVFMQNVVEHLSTRSGEDGIAFRPGEPISVRTAAGTADLHIDGPLRAAVAAQAGLVTTLPALRRAGLYSVAGGLPPMDRIAVNVASDVESDARPRSINAAAENQALRTDAAISGRELWPWLAGAAMALLILEWLVYCRQARG